MRALFLAAVVMGLGCGGSPPIPRRGVVEADLGAWKFRRFQEVLDVEVWVEGNKAAAFSASYITADAEKRGRIGDQDLVNVFVTRYAAPEGVVRATVKLARRLAQDGGYQVEEDKIAGARTLTITGRGEAWVMWPSHQHVVKVGGRGRSEVPRSMVENYVERYPSQLPGGSLEGPLPPGPAEAPKAGGETPEYDSAAPKPNIDNYDPSKVKLPDAAADPAGGAAAPVPDDAKPASTPSPAPSAKPVKPTKPTKPKPSRKSK